MNLEVEKLKNDQILVDLAASKRKRSLLEAGERKLSSNDGPHRPDHLT